MKQIELVFCNTFLKKTRLTNIKVKERSKPV